MDAPDTHDDPKGPATRVRPARFGDRDADVRDGGPAGGRDEAGPTPTAAHEYVEACLMLALGEGPAYGYALKGELDDLGLEGLDRGRIYRALRAMEAAGVVVSHWETAGRGPARRTYDLTPRGHERLQAQVLAVRRQRRQLSRFLSRYERSRPAQSDAVA